MQLYASLAIEVDLNLKPATGRGRERGPNKCESLNRLVGRSETGQAGEGVDGELQSACQSKAHNP